MNKNVRVVIVNYENKHNKIYLFDSEHNFFLSCNKYNHVLTSLLTHLNFETIAQRDIEYNLETRMKYQYVELN